MKKLIPLLLCFVLLLCACNAEAEPDVEESPSPTLEIDLGPVFTPQPQLTPDPAERVDPEFANPLTGLEIKEEYVNSRPYAVMLNNIREAQPQFGISQADIVYEVCAEGGITRMLALYQDIGAVGSIGSIRSARPYYVELALGHDAIFLHAGGSEQAYSDISSKGVTAFDAVRGSDVGSLFWRDQQRISANGYEHSVFTSGEAALSDISGRNIRHEHESAYEYEQEFAWEATPEGGYAASTVAVEFSGYKTGTFEYDEGLYYASQYGSAHVDAGNSEQVAVSNLLVLYTNIYVLDDVGRLSVSLTGSGEGKYFCGGRGIDILWSRDAGGQFFYTLEDGTPLVMERGRSYVCIIQSGNSVTYS